MDKDQGGDDGGKQDIQHPCLGTAARLLYGDGVGDGAEKVGLHQQVDQGGQGKHHGDAGHAGGQLLGEPNQVAVRQGDRGGDCGGDKLHDLLNGFPADIAGLMQGAVNLGIEEQLAIAVIHHVWLDGTDPSLLRHIGQTGGRVADKVPVILVGGGFNQTEMSIHIRKAAGNSLNEGAEHLAHTVDLVRHGPVHGQTGARTRRISHQVQGTLLDKGEGVGILGYNNGLLVPVSDIGLAAAGQVGRKHHIAPAGQLHGPGVITVTLVGAAMHDQHAGRRVLIRCVLGQIDQRADGAAVIAGERHPLNGDIAPTGLEAPDENAGHQQDRQGNAEETDGFLCLGSCLYIVCHKNLPLLTSFRMVTRGYPGTPPAGFWPAHSSPSAGRSQ